MDRISARIVLDHDATIRLFEIYQTRLGESRIMAFLSEVIDFIEHSNVLLYLPNELDPSELEKNFFLRSILTRAYSGEKGCLVFGISRDDPSILKGIRISELIRVKMLTSKVGFPEFRDWFEVKSLPLGWEHFTNNRKNTIVVGGTKSIFKSWTEFDLTRFPVSSIIIIDPYLLKEKGEILANVPKILDGLVDFSRITHSVDLLLVVGDNVNKRLDFEQYVDRNSKLLGELVSERYRKGKINVSIAYVKGEYLHDRYIFTNYYFIDAGRGFNLYNERDTIDKRKPNKVTLKFLSSSLAFSEFVDLIKSYCDVLYDRNAVSKLQGSLESNEILNLMRSLS